MPTSAETNHGDGYLGVRLRPSNSGGDIVSFESSTGVQMLSAAVAEADDQTVVTRSMKNSSKLETRSWVGRPGIGTGFEPVDDDHGGLSIGDRDPPCVAAR